MLRASLFPPKEISISGLCWRKLWLSITSQQRFFISKKLISLYKVFLSCNLFRHYPISCDDKEALATDTWLEGEKIPPSRLAITMTVINTKILNNEQDSYFAWPEPFFGLPPLSGHFFQHQNQNRDLSEAWKKTKNKQKHDHRGRKIEFSIFNQ